jgi:hypothetical protein
MHGAILAVLLFLAADPFWVAKPPQQWTDIELAQLLADSPWARQAEGPGTASRPAPVAVYLATAGPVDQAERERARRAKPRSPSADTTAADLLAEEYRAWLAENRATQVVLAVRVSDVRAFADEREVRRMEDGCAMRIGRRKIKMTGHFPPSSADPYLRLAFPRQAQLSDKTLVFELYVPGVPIPFRMVEFSLKDMVVNGKLEL